MEPKTHWVGNRKMVASGQLSGFILVCERVSFAWSNLYKPQVYLGIPMLYLDLPTMQTFYRTCLVYG